MCYKAVDILMTAGEIFNFFFLKSRIGFYISVLEQKYVQEISRAYDINKWSYVQVVRKRSFYGNELREMTKIVVRNRLKEKVENCREKVWLDIKNLVFSDITDSYCNEAKTH